jgi:hypothetical protein
MRFARTLGTERMMLKRRPECRNFILKANLLPDIVRVGTEHVWDGRTARDASNGQRKTLTREMPEGTERELRRLARSGQWGDLSGTVLDWFKYSRLREIVDGKRQGLFEGVSLWQPRSRNRGTTRRTLKRKR